MNTYPPVYSSAVVVRSRPRESPSQQAAKREADFQHENRKYLEFAKAAAKLEAAPRTTKSSRKQRDA